MRASQIFPDRQTSCVCSPDSPHFYPHQEPECAMSTVVPEKPPGAPQDPKQYPGWLKDKFDYDVSAGEVEFAAVASRVLTSFTNSPFWKDLGAEIPSIHERFKLRTGYDLFYRPEMPTLVQKTFASFLDKTFRRNFIKPSADPTTAQWFDPDQWYEGIDDVVRTRFVVKYLDGVETFTAALGQLCEKHGRKYRSEFKCSDFGYYAAHFYLIESIDVPLLTGTIKTLRMWIELQVTTQLQEVLLTSLHKLYEKTRSTYAKDDVPWQWRYREDEFFTNYLGHMLHNIEGMIMEVRRREENNARVQSS